MRRMGLGTGILAIGMLVFTVLFAGVADAALVARETFVGNYGLSTDGWGGTDSSGTISADVPFGATVEAAYLYSATYGNDVGGVTLNGGAVAFSSTWANSFMKTGFSDVTSIVKPLIDGGSGGVYNFTVAESNSNGTDGEALVVVYNLASLPNATVAILDGPQALTGDTFYANFANPINTAELGFFAEMRLGISFSSQIESFLQQSNVTVNGTLISGLAGNYDDGAHANGALMTVGGFDDPFSPYLPSSSEDHERYNLVPYITNGSTSIRVDTINPSNDDNIFLAAFYLKGIAAINEDPPTNGVPEPGTLLLLGSGLVGLVGYRRTKRMM